MEELESIRKTSSTATKSSYTSNNLNHKKSLLLFLIFSAMTIIGTICLSIQMLQKMAYPIEWFAKTGIYQDEFVARFEKSLLKNPTIAIIGDSVIDYGEKEEGSYTSVIGLLSKQLNQPILDASHSGIALKNYIDIVELLQKRGLHFGLLIIQINPAYMLRPYDALKHANWKNKLDIQSHKKNIFPAFFESILDHDQVLSKKKSETDNTKEFEHLFIPEVTKAKQLYGTKNTSSVDLILEALYQNSKMIANKVVFFITPIDFIALQKLINTETLETIKERIPIIEASCQKMGAACINYSLLVGNDTAFIPPGYGDIGITVHLPQKLRERLASQITKDLLKGNFVPLHKSDV